MKIGFRQIIGGNYETTEPLGAYGYVSIIRIKAGLWIGRSGIYKVAQGATLRAVVAQLDSLLSTGEA